MADVNTKYTLKMGGSTQEIIFKELEGLLDHIRTEISEAQAVDVLDCGLTFHIGECQMTDEEWEALDEFESW